MCIRDSTGANGTFSGNITAVNGTFSGDVSIAGTITYEDVTHVDSQGIGTFRQGIEVIGHSEVDTLRASGIATFQSNVHLADNVKINLGTGDDLQIYHDGNHSRIVDSGTGNLVFQSNRVDIQNADGSENLAIFESTGVKLYYNDDKKFETTGYGATVTGDLRVGTAVTVYGNAGIVSATQYYGDGSKLTGVAAAGGGALDITSCLFI